MTKTKIIIIHLTLWLLLSVLFLIVSDRLCNYLITWSLIDNAIVGLPFISACFLLSLIVKLGKNKTAKITYCTLIGLYICWLAWAITGYQYGYVLGKYYPDQKVFITIYGTKLEMQNGLFKVSLKFPFKTEGYINKDGKIVIPLVYYGIYPFNKAGLAVVNKYGCRGIIDTLGHELLKPIYGNITGESFYDGDNDQYFILSKNYGFEYEMLESPIVYDIEKRKTIINGEYDRLNIHIGRKNFPFLLGVKNNKEQYLIDKKSLYAIKKPYLIFNLDTTNHKNLFKIRTIPSASFAKPVRWEMLRFGYLSGGKDSSIIDRFFLPKQTGIINEKGVDIIPPKYSEIEDFNKKLFLVSTFKNTVGVIDTSGKIIAPPVFYGARLLPTLPLIELYSGYKTYWIAYNGVVILSSKIYLAHSNHEDKDGPFEIFVYKNNRYRLTYDDEKKKFNWRRLSTIKIKTK